MVRPGRTRTATTGRLRELLSPWPWPPMLRTRSFRSLRRAFWPWNSPQETLEQPRKDLAEAQAVCCGCGAVYACGSFGLKRFELPDLPLGPYRPYKLA